MGPLAILIAGGAVYYIYEKQKNPAWSPFTRLLATPVDKVVALEKVKVTSVPTPSPTVALDPHMTTDQVKQVNRTLTSETDPKKIAAHAIALSAAGHNNSAMALAAKANAVGEAKATGAHDVDIHLKQIEAAQATRPEHAPVPIDAPMTACEAQVLLNVLASQHGDPDIEGVPVPLAITNVFDADTSHLVRLFQAEMGLPATGVMNGDTAKALRVAVLGSAVSNYAVGWWDERGHWHRHHHHHHYPEEIVEMDPAVGWGPIASGSSGPIATGFYGEPYGGWTQPWEHGFVANQGTGWPWHYGWHGFVGEQGFEHHAHERHEHERRGREPFGRGGRGHEQQFGRGRGGEHEQFGRGFHPQHQGFGEEMLPMHPHHRRHLTHEEIMQRQAQERERLAHAHHHRRHPHHPAQMQQMQQMQQQPAPEDDTSQDAQEAALPAGMPIGGGGGASAMAAPAVEPDHTGDGDTGDTGDHAADAGATATQGWWPEFAYWPMEESGDYGGYGYIGEGGPGGLGGYGSWGSYGGWGHGL